MIPAPFAPLLSHIWQSTLFAAVAALLALALRRNQARVRCWLWLAASYKFLIPFSLLVSIGGLFRWRAAPAAIPHAVATVTNFVSDPVFLTTDSTVQPASNHPPMLLLAIWVVWACGFVVVLARWMREWMRIRAIVRAAAPLQLNLPVRVASTAARMEPGVFGIFRPVLLLPEGIADRLTSDQLQAVLAHELCHVRRRDNLTAAIHMLVEGTFWFYPLVWWLGTRIIDERERACDEEVLRAGSHAQVYAESILRVCEFYLESPLTCISGISGSDLKKRIQRIMSQRLGIVMSGRKKLLLATAAILAVAGPFGIGAFALQSNQTPATSDWQSKAGGKITFEVASVKQDTAAPSPQTVNSNVPLGPGDYYTPTGGLFSATNLPLFTYVTFAFKATAAQIQTLQAEAPKWVLSDRFDIEARAEGNPTKDQLRLMMQSLLADRFELAVHTEMRQAPVFALLLAKHGKTGPQLQSHPGGTACSSAPPAGSAYSAGPPATVIGGFPVTCGGIQGMKPSEAGRIRIGARNVPMAMIAGAFSIAQLTGVGRPVLDKTGLIGTFDFVVEFTPQVNGALPPDTNFTPDPNGPTFLEALKEQLGLKLESTKGPVDVLVIDHVEQPTPN